MNAVTFWLTPPDGLTDSLTWSRDGEIVTTRRTASGFVASDSGGWLPGMYESHETARDAAFAGYAFCKRIWDIKADSLEGIVTMADLKEGGL